MSFKNIMKDRGFNQTSLAKKLGVSQVLIHKWISGKCEPQLEKLRELSEILKIDLEDLINSFLNKEIA